VLPRSLGRASLVLSLPLAAACATTGGRSEEESAADAAQEARWREAYDFAFECVEGSVPAGFVVRNLRNVKGVQPKRAMHGIEAARRPAMPERDAPFEVVWINVTEAAGGDSLRLRAGAMSGRYAGENGAYVEDAVPSTLALRAKQAVEERCGSLPHPEPRSSASGA